MATETVKAREEQKLFGPEMLADPYPVYHRLRAAGPIHWMEELDAWVVTSYEAVSAALRHPQLVPDRFDRIRKRLAAKGQGGLGEQMPGPFSSSWDNPRESTRLRGLLNKVFSPRAVIPLEQRIQGLVNGYLDAAGSRGRMDVIQDLASPLPITVIAELLGLPVEDGSLFKKWSDEISIVLGGDVTALKEEEVRRAVASRSELVDYLRAVVARRRLQPGNDLLTTLVEAEEDGTRLREEELYHIAVLLLVAGNTTTTNLIGNGLLALLQNPDQQRRLWYDPSLTATAVEEMLHYDSPVQFTMRLARSELEIHGNRIESGQWVYLLLGAANRDPARFPKPDRFNVGREENKHLSFSAGPHSCLGAPLARLEAHVTIRTLCQRVPGLRMWTERVERQTNFNLRGLKSLVVYF